MPSPFVEIRHLPENGAVAISFERKLKPRYRFARLAALVSAVAAPVGILGVLLAGTESGWVLVLGLAMTAMAAAIVTSSGTGPRYMRGKPIAGGTVESQIGETVEGGHHAG